MSESSTRWAVLRVTEVGGIQPYSAPDSWRVNYQSFLFFSPRDAKLDLLDAWKCQVDAHFDHPEDYEDDDIPSFDGWVQQVELHPDGAITSEDFEWTVQDIYGFFGMEVPK